MNSALTWHGSTLRNGSVTLLSTRIFVPLFGAPSAEEVTNQHALPTLKAALKDLDTYWLAASKYVAGDQVSIADLLLAAEVEELRLQDYSGRVCVRGGGGGRQGHTGGVTAPRTCFGRIFPR